MAQSKDMVYIMNCIPKKSSKRLIQLTDERFGHLGLKAYHTIVIAAIGNDPGTSQKHIMENVPFNKARVSIIVSELMEMGYVTDVSKGKSSSLFLTEEGKDIYEISSEIFMLHHEALLSVFSEEEREVLHRMMIMMDEVLDDMLS